MTADLDFLLLVDRRAPEGNGAQLDAIVAATLLHAPALTLVESRCGWRLLIDKARLSRSCSEDGSIQILGDVFDRSGTLLTSGRLDRLARDSTTVTARGRWLVEQAWGRYIALLRVPTSVGAISCLRDPMGTLPAYRCGWERIVALAGAAPRWLTDMLGGTVSPDWDRIGETLGHPPVCTYRSLLTGVDQVPAGTLFPLVYGSPTTLWQPGQIAGGSQIAGRQEAAALLRASTRQCMAGWGARYRRPLLELSGGLDSAVVLGTVDRRTSAAAITFSTGFVAGDERHYARDAAARAGINLIEHFADAECMDYTALVDDIPSATPRLYGLDPQHDDAVAGAAARHGADAIFTGQGGDAVFFQMPTALLALDQARAGLNRRMLEMALIAARRARCSVWRILRDIARDRRRLPTAIDRYDRRLLSPALAAALGRTESQHPWLEGQASLPPAKRLQLEAITNGQMFMLPTRRGRQAPLIHPLLSQPIVEACLSIPTYVLAPDERDRGLARDAFADVLPDTIRQRSGKGEASNYFSRALVANLPLVRDWLLDGALARAGLLDRAALEETLTEDRLLWANEAGPPMLYLNIEAWVRQWLD